MVVDLAGAHCLQARAAACAGATRPATYCPDQMRAAVLYELGTIPAFTDFKEPHADERHDVLEVLLAGLNPVDLYIASGMYGEVSLPCVVGLEGIAQTADGGRVYFNGPPKPFGSMAEPAQALRRGGRARAGRGREHGRGARGSGCRPGCLAGHRRVGGVAAADVAGE